MNAGKVRAQQKNFEPEALPSTSFKADILKPGNQNHKINLKPNGVMVALLKEAGVIRPFFWLMANVSKGEQ